MTVPRPPLDWQTRESLVLAPWAMRAADSAGRGERQLLIQTPEDTDGPENRRVEMTSY